MRAEEILNLGGTTDYITFALSISLERAFFCLLALLLNLISRDYQPEKSQDACKLDVFIVIIYSEILVIYTKKGCNEYEE